MSDPHEADPPSPFMERWVRDAAAEEHRAVRALDVAMGRGRHATILSDAGYRVFGVDVRTDAVLDAVARAATTGTRLCGWVADLRMFPLPRDRFDLVLVARYLQRDLFPALAGALAPHGVLLYETFTAGQRRLGHGPTSPAHLLEPLELRQAFTELGLQILFYEETDSPDCLARLAARRTSRS